jgi:hypothetical protein
MNINDILNKFTTGLNTQKYINDILYYSNGIATKMKPNNIPLKNISKIRIVCVSDTHSLHELLDVPNCDIFIHNGDIALQGRVYSDDESIKFYKKFNEWLGTIQATTKIVIGGNHDYYLEKIGEIEAQKLLSNCNFLMNSSLTTQGITFFGSPINIGNSKNKAYQSKPFFNKFAEEIEKQKVDILLTHSNVVDPHILKKYGIKNHIWGHYHEHYGIYKQEYKGFKWTSFCTCSLDGSYSLKNGPIVIDY